MLTIRDLAITADLDRSALSAIRGGFARLPYHSLPGWTMPAVYAAPEHKFSFDASQMIGQSQNVMNNNGNNVAFASGISSTVNPTQSASNNINF